MTNAQNCGAPSSYWKAVNSWVDGVWRIVKPTNNLEGFFCSSVLWLSTINSFSCQSTHEWTFVLASTDCKSHLPTKITIFSKLLPLNQLQTFLPGGDTIPKTKLRQQAHAQHYPYISESFESLASDVIVPPAPPPVPSHMRPRRDPSPPPPSYRIVAGKVVSLT